MELISKQMEKVIDKYDDILRDKGYNKPFHIYLDHVGRPGKILKEFIMENKTKIEEGIITKVTIDSDLKKKKFTGEYVVVTFDFVFNKKSGLQMEEMSIIYLLGQEGQMDDTFSVKDKADIPSQSKSIKKAESMRWGEQKRKKRIKI